MSSGERTILPGARTPSTEMVIVPKRVLVRIYATALKLDQLATERAHERVEANAARRELEELLSTVAPSVVHEVLLARRDEEPTKPEIPDARDMEKSKRS